MICSLSSSTGSIATNSSIRASGTPLVRLRRICLAIISSFSALTSSLIIQIMSNLEASGASKPVSLNERMTLVLAARLEKRPSFGLAAAIIAHLEGKEAVIPPLEISILCCSIAGCMTFLSSSDILSNSSIAANPLSDNGNTPASKENLPSAKVSLTAAAVNPAPETPPPDANLPRGESSET